MDFNTEIIIVILIFVMIAVMYLELRVMRRRSKARLQRTARSSDQVQDEAHNALITTRAISATMAERSGVRSEDVDGMLREAQLAYDRHNYRVTLDLATRVKDRLVTLKAVQTAQGDLAKLEATPSGTAASEEPTTKEVLQKQYPPNLVQSRFAISVAETSIQEGTAAGRDTAAAQSLLAAARSRFDAQDYGGALSAARQAEKSAKGEGVVVPVPPPAAPGPESIPAPAVTSQPSVVAVPAGSACPSCGAPMKPGDAFCRKCGTRAVLTNCPNCGAALLPDDAFCRKCGTRLAR